MPGTVNHVLTATTPDDPLYEIRPSHWNSSHAVTFDAAGSEIVGAFSNANGLSFGLSAGQVTGSYTVPTVPAQTEYLFSNANGVSFGTAGSTVTATVKTDYLTTAALSNHSHGNPQLNLTNLSGTTASNSAGFTLSLSAAAPGGGAAVNFSAGTTSGNLQSVTFADGGGVSFGLNAGTITATVATNYLTSQSNQAFSAPGGSSAFQTLVFANSQGVSWSNSNGSVVATVKTDYLTTARASNDAVGLNTALTAGPLAWTVNSSGISLNAGSAAGTTSGFGGNLISGSMTHNTAGLNLSLNHPAWLTTAMASNAATLSNIRVSAGTTSNLLSAVTFADGNGVSFGLNAGAVTGSHNGLTTAALSNHSHGNPQLNLTNLSGTTASNSAGFTLSLSAAAPGGGGSINFSAGTTSNNLASVTFADAGGVSFGINAGTITASAPAAAAANNTHTINGVTAFNASTASFQNGNINFLVAGNLIGGFSTGTPNSLVLYAIPPPQESIFFRPYNLVTTIGAPINASASVVYVPMDVGVSASRFDMLASINVATAANNSSAGFLYSITAVAYTKNGGTLSSVSSATTNNQMTWTSNATGSVTGGFFLSAPLAFNATGADKFWFGLQLSTRATGLTGAATTSLGNTVSMMGVGSAIIGAFSAREPGAGTANSNGWFYGLGMYSGTSNFSTIGLSNLTQQGTNAARADVALRLVNV